MLGLVTAAIMLGLAGAGIVWFAMRPAASTSSARTATPSSTTPTALSPTAIAACKALQAAGVDGQADPSKMRDVAKIGSDALDTVIKADSDALFAAAESGATDDPAVQIRVMSAASNMMTDCLKGGYIKP